MPSVKCLRVGLAKAVGRPLLNSLAAAALGLSLVLAGACGPVDRHRDRSPRYYDNDYDYGGYYHDRQRPSIPDKKPNRPEPPKYRPDRPDSGHLRPGGQKPSDPPTQVRPNQPGRDKDRPSQTRPEQPNRDRDKPGQARPEQPNRDRDKPSQARPEQPNRDRDKPSQARPPESRGSEPKEAPPAKRKPDADDEEKGRSPRRR